VRWLSACAWEFFSRISSNREIDAKSEWVRCHSVSTPRYLDLPDQVRQVVIHSHRGAFAALDARPASGVCERLPALLVPGFTGSKEDFLPVLQPLASAGRRVVAIDMRGQYQTEGGPDPGGYAPAELAADIAAIASAIAADGQGVHLLGHSFGGLIAREAALAAQTPLMSLTLLSSGPASLSGERAELLEGMLALLDETASSAEQMRAAVAMAWDEHLEPEARADGVPEHIIEFLRRRMLSNSPMGLVVMARYLLACPDRTAELANLAGPPILVLYGENDDAWLPAVQERMARRLGAQRVCIPGAGHSPAIEAPETTASTLTAFWRAAEESERRRRARRSADSGHSGEAGTAEGPATSRREALGSAAPSPRAPGSPAEPGSAAPTGSPAAAGAPAASPVPSPSHGRRGSDASLPSGQRAR
jgi:pimeloyl-ACP methyl ester carboxylesterase